MNNEFYLEGDGWGTRQICPLTPKKENIHLTYNEEDRVYSFKNENNLRIEFGDLCQYSQFLQTVIVHYNY